MSRINDLKQTVKEYKKELKKHKPSSPYRSWYNKAIKNLETTIKSSK